MDDQDPYYANDQFINCLEDETVDFIWINDDVALLFDDLWAQYFLPLEITRELTIASGRSSSSSGALIKLTSADKAFMFISRANVRFSGLRIYGPAEFQDFDKKLTGLNVKDEKLLVVDNCDIRYWNGSAISINHNSVGVIHHNRIHENRYGYGYGVTVGNNGSAKIEANLFKNNRHSIAGVGHAGDNYIAGWNIIEEPTGNQLDDPPQFPSHDFDMHRDPGTEIAGKFMVIYNNTFKYGPGQDLVYRGNIYIGGKPVQYVKVIYNKFNVDNPEKAIRQGHYFGNIQISYADNTYKNALSKGWYINWNARNYWYRITTEDANVTSFTYHDFTGDGQTNVFWADGENWKIASFYKPYGMLYRIWESYTEWETINSSSLTLNSLRFGDFNGDGQTDVFASWGGYWRVSWSGTSSWQTLRQASENVTQLAFGDFNGDGKADVFTVEYDFWNDIIYWKVSWGGTSSYQIINTWQISLFEMVNLDKIRFGDFNGNGTTDLFTVWNGDWYVSWGGITGWDKINSYPLMVDELRFGDFNADGITDIFTTEDGYWKVWYRGVDLDVLGGPSGAQLENLKFVDFNGDGFTDVITMW